MNAALFLLHTSVVRRLSYAVLAAALVASALGFEIVHAISTDVVISEFRTRGPAGGNDEFIELYNLSQAPIDIGGWKIKASNGAATPAVGVRAIIPAGMTLGPGCHYLLTNAAASGYSGTVAGDQTYTTGVADDGGLAITTPADVIVDQVGMSANSAFKETDPLAPQLTTNVNRSFERKPGGAAGSGQDTDNNPADFQLVSPSDPQNRAACGNPAGTGSATPNPVPRGAETILSVVVRQGSPAFPISAVNVDLTLVGGASAQPLFDDGTNGDLAAGDLTYSFRFLVPSTVVAKNYDLPVTITDTFGRAGKATIALTIQPPFFTIPEIQGAGDVSPLAGQGVTTEGVVTAIKSSSGRGFFIQTTTADADPNTSEGVFVFTNSTPTTTVGDFVRVSGTVTEFAPARDPFSPTSTEITGATIAVLLSGTPLPDPVTIATADIDSNGTLTQLERFEGMRVHVASLTVVSPTGGTIVEANASSTTNGVFYAVMTGVPRPFREPGVEVPDPLPAGSPAGVPRFDGNPERLRVDSDAQPGAVPLDVAVGAVVLDMTGVLEYSPRAYTILPDPVPVPSVVGSRAAAFVSTPTAHHFTIATANLERFFDTTDDPGISDVALTPDAFNIRLNKASLQIRNVMQLPTIIGVEEVENLSVLQAIADKVNVDSPGAVHYQAFLFEGNDIGGIDDGFLVDTNRVVVRDVQQVNKDETYIDPNTNQPALLNDRPPTVLHATLETAVDGPVEVTVIANHLRSLSGIDDPVNTANARRIRAKRQAQANSVARLIQWRQAANPNDLIVAVGDFNAFQFSDGYVDVIGTIKGTPAPADQVVIGVSDDLVTPDLTDLVDTAAARDRYSFLFDGNAQALDHIIVNAAALPLVDDIQWGRSNADFPESLRRDPTRPERLSDHDPVVAYFRMPEKTTTMVTATPNPVAFGQLVTFTATVIAADTVDTGIVTFKDGDRSLGSAMVVNGQAMLTDVPLVDLGSHAITAMYSDSVAFGPSTSDVLTVMVKDLEPPVLAVNDVIVEANGPGGSVVTFAITATDDVDGTDSVSCTPSSGSTFAIGKTTVQCSATDAAGNIGRAQFTVTVQDTTPPAIVSLVPNPALLWPPNGKLVPVRIAASVRDVADANPACRIVTITSNEPADRRGRSNDDDDDDGDHDNDDGRKARPRIGDIVITGKLTALLRAERNRHGAERIYTINVECVDAAGNKATDTTTVPVRRRR